MKKLSQEGNHTQYQPLIRGGALSPGGRADPWDEVVSVETKVQNTGAAEGAEVAQLSVTFPSEAAQPARVLRGFETVSVAPGHSADVTFSVRRRDLGSWDTAAQQWAVAEGQYTFAVGASSRDIRGSAELAVQVVSELEWS